MLLQTRAYPRSPAGKKMAIRFGSWDSTVSLTAAFFVNAAILILAAAAFYVHGNRTVACESLALFSAAVVGWLQLLPLTALCCTCAGFHSHASHVCS